MRHCYYTILMMYCLFAGGLVAAQNNSGRIPLNDLIFHNVNDPKEFAGLHILDMVQDAKGYIWLAAVQGLYRYDGFRLQLYKDSSEGKTGKEYFYKVYFDKERNRLLLLTPDFNTIRQLNLLTGRLSALNLQQEWRQGKSVLYLDSAGRRWQKQEYFISRQSDDGYLKTGIAFIKAPGKPAPYVSVYTKDEWNKGTWANGAIKSNFDMVYWKENTKRIYFPPFSSAIHPFGSIMAALSTRSIEIDNHGNLWLSQWSNFFYRYNIFSQRVFTYSLNNLEKNKAKFNANPTHFLQDNHGRLWAGCDYFYASLLEYDFENDRFNTLKKQPENKLSLQYNFETYGLFQDREDNIWIATDKGLSNFNPYRQYFTKNTIQLYDPQTEPQTEINALIQLKDGCFVVGTWGNGFGIYDTLFRLKKKFFFNRGVNQVWSVVQGDDESVWVGCQGGVIHMVDPGDYSVKTIQPPETEGRTVRVMKKDKEGNILLGLQSGKIVIWEKRTRKFLRFNEAAQPDTWAHSPITDIYIDHAGRCWAATPKGLLEFDIKTQRFTGSFYQPTGAEEVLFNGLSAYNDSTLLATSANRGLYFFNTNKKTFTQIKAQAGEADIPVAAAAKDEEHNIWFSAGYDIYKYNPAQNKSIVFHPERGLFNSPFFSNHFLQTPTGKWISYTATELISFTPSAITSQKSTDPVAHITGLKVFDRPLPADSILNTGGEAVLSYRQNFLTIEFSDLRYSNPAATQYYYRLSGVDKGWVHAANTGSASYTNLEPGSYTFEVTTNEQDNKAGMATLYLYIAPPFWKTWWFKAACLAAFAGIVFIILQQQYRKNKELRHHLQLEQITNFFTSSVASKNNAHDILWDVARNLVSKLELVDCMLYLWNDSKTKLIQIAGYGPKGSIEEIKKQPFEVVPGQGVVGYVAQTKKPMLIPDTSAEPRYRVDEMRRLSELCVPMIYNDELVGIIDSEHHEKNFYTERHLQIFNTMATLIANKIKSIETEEFLQKKKLEAALLDQELAKMEIKALHTQMNPHFIFNCLGSIKQMILANEQENANKYLNKFARMIRLSLEHSRRSNITIREKLDYLSNYLEMERLRFDNSFNYMIEVDEHLTPEETIVPPMMVQPLVENAIWHGLMNKQGERQLFVRYKLQNGHLVCEVEDNGIGIYHSRDNQSAAHRSFGIQNIRRRLELLNQKYHTQCSLSFIDKSEHSETETGTIAILTLPFSNLDAL